MKLIPILDNGHGQETNGKRSPDFGRGILFEWEFNRDIVDRVARRLKEAFVPYHVLVPEHKDIDLNTRCKRTNKIYATNSKTYLVSIHSNAGGGTGFEGFTTIGETKSDKLCSEFLNQIKKDFPEQSMRSEWIDGDIDKESNFWILKNTNCPAMLLELLFMDNRNDYELLMDKNFRDDISHSLAKTIIKLYAQ